MNIAIKTCFPLVALALACLAPPALANTSSTLTFEGRIKPGTCAIATGDVGRKIELPELTVPDFTGGLAGAEEFQLTVDCTGTVSQVTFKFSGTPNPADPQRFVNTGTAKGVGLLLSSKDAGGSFSTIRPSDSRTVTVASRKAVMPLRAGYYTHNASAVEQGSFVSTVTVDITYN